MNDMQKFGSSFVLALSLHLGILGFFIFGFEHQPEVEIQKPVPEIIKASVLDDNQVIAEAQRLKQHEIDKKLAQQRKQQALDKKRKQEQKLLQQAREKRQQEEKRAQELTQKRQQQAIKEQKRLAQIKKQRAEETARLAKIKKQQAEEKRHLEQQRQAAAKKKEQQKKAEEERKQALLAKQQAEKVRREAQAKQQAAAAKAKAEQDKQATLSATAAIQRKVNNSWIRPMTASKGLNCTVQVKLLSSGDVMDASVIRSSGDDIFDRSAENAVRKASPLPVPRDKTLFTRKFRTFTIVFKPE